MSGPIRLGEQKNLSATDGKEGVISQDGKPVAPEQTIPTASAARTIYERLQHQHLQRAHNYRRIQGMIDGNPPFNQQALAAAGLNDMANVNWKDADSIFRSVGLAYWSLFNEVKNIISIKTTFTNDEGMNAEWSKILSEEWDKIIRLWPTFNKHMTLHQGEMIKFGLSGILWGDERDWRFKPIDVSRFYFPDQTRNDPEALTLIVIEEKYEAQYLWDVYEGASDSGPWSKEALGEVLLQLANIPDDDRHNYYNTDILQQKIRNGDFYYTDLYNDDIALISLLSREYESGKVTHQMIHRRVETPDFVYEAVDQYEEMCEAFFYFTYEPGNKTIHGSKGLGHKMFSPVQAITHLDCSVLDQAKRAGTLLIKSGPSRGRDDRQIKFVHGGVIDVGEAEIAQNTMGNNVAQTVEVSRYFRDKVFTNNNISGNDPGFPDKNIRSGNRQAQMQVLKEAQVQKNQIAHYYLQLDFFFKEIVRKMLKSRQGWPGYEYVKMWKDACIERGIPEQVFDYQKAPKKPDGMPIFLDVSATRSSGAGSQMADQLTMQRVMEVMPTMGERGKINALMDYIAAFRGHEYVDRYFPPEDRQKQPTGDDTIASIENNQLSEGKQVIVSPDNNHLIHAQNHMRLMSEVMKMYQQDPQMMIEEGKNVLQWADEIMQVTGPHFVKHLFFLAQDPTVKAQVQELNAQWAVLANFGDQVAVNANRQREAEQRKVMEQQQAMQQAQDQNTPEHIKARADVELKARKLEEQIRRDRTRDRHKFALAAEQLRKNSKLQELKTLNELALEERKARAEDERADSRTVADTRREDFKAVNTVRRENEKDAE